MAAPSTQKAMTTSPCPVCPAFQADLLVVWRKRKCIHYSDGSQRRAESGTHGGRVLSWGNRNRREGGAWIGPTSATAPTFPSWKKSLSRRWDARSPSPSLGGGAGARAAGRRTPRVQVAASGSIIKNAKSVVVPHTGGLKGIEAAAAAGIVAGEAARGLEVIADVSPADVEKVVAYLGAPPSRLSARTRALTSTSSCSVRRGGRRARRGRGGRPGAPRARAHRRLPHEHRARGA